MLRLTVDGRPHEIAEGGSVLDALRGLGVDVPTLCYDERFAAQGACRMCMVEVDGRRAPVAACTTPVEDGMAVTTQSGTLERLRRTLLGLLGEDYPAAAVDAAGAETDADTGATFHRLLRQYDLTGECQAEPLRAARRDTSHPFIDVDMARCISCFRCVRICEELQGQSVWRIVDRGAGTEIVPDSGTTLAASTCVSCGACVDTCPTGALSDKQLDQPDRLDQPTTTWTRTTCAYCGVGCELQVGTRDDTIVGVRPAHDAPVNKGHLCVKGRYGYGFNGSPERLTTPLRRDHDGVLRPVSWVEAVETIAGRLERVLTTRGPSAVGVLGSARATNEDNYVTQKFARTVLDTNNVDCCARVCHAPSAAALSEMLGTGASTSSYDDIEQAQTILVCGSNATENHPVVGARIKQAALHGAHLVVIDPRRIELAEYAEIHLRPRPGTNVPLLNALASVIVEEGLVDSSFLHTRVDSYDDYAHWIRAYTPELVADTCGVDPAQIRAAARLYALERPALSFHGLGLTEHSQGTEAVMCLVNLALLSGNVGRPGAGVNPLRGQNNVQGAAHMGCEPHRLTGYVPVAEARDRFADAWGVTLPERAGLDAMEMLDAAANGELDALWVVGWDVLLTQPATPSTRRALQQLDLLVVQDIFLNETARELAHVVLPAASAFEKDGTFMNAERRVQRVRKALDPPGAAKPDWQIFQLVAGAMDRGHLFGYGSAEAIWDEVRQMWPPGRGMTYTRLAAPGGLQWPCPDEGHPGTTLLHTEDFPRLGRRTRLRQIDDQALADRPDDDYPFVLVTGRGLYQFNAGTMTRRTPIAELYATDVLEITAADARRLGLGDGDPVQVSSRHGKAVLPAQITERVPPGVVFATFSDPAVDLNAVIGPQVDAITHTPDYKVTAAGLSRCDDRTVDVRSTTSKERSP